LTVRFALVPVVVALVLASGCGGSSDTSSASDWANNFCSALATWSSSVRSTANSLKANPSKDSLKSAAGDLESASNTLVSDLKDLGKPDTKAGQDAKDAIDQLSSEVEDDVQEMKSAVDKASGVQGVVTAASSVSATLSKMGTQINSALSKLGSADPGGELKQAFRDSSACKNLTSSGP
jgi:hypothetical protein